ncbi:fancl [Carabus blaptoides fortunei]
MVSMQTNMKLLFPTVASLDPSNRKFVAVFKHDENDSVFVMFNVPNYPNASSVTYESDLELTEAGVKILQAHNADKLNFLEYLKLFKHALASVPKKRVFRNDLFRTFYDEYCELTAQYPDDKFVFNRALETFTIARVDSCMVVNTVVIQLNFYDSSSTVYTVLTSSFPEIKPKKLFAKQYSLKVIHQQFLGYVEELSAFHETLQRIDMLCWVTAPPNPTFEHNYRTIMISDNCVSIKIIFDPWNMSKLPEFKFLGPSAILETFRSTLSENLANWDPDYDVLHNVMQLLDLNCFPMKPAPEEAADKEVLLYDRDTECSVCFTYHLNDEAPDVTCDYESCRRQFHNHCLYEWLSRLPNCQIMFGTINGECPNCEKTVSCKVPTL